MSTSPPPPEKTIITSWSTYLTERNRQRARVAHWIVALGFPAFGLLDYLSVPSASLPLLWSSRVAVTLITVLLMLIWRSDFFARHILILTSAHMTLVGATIGLMIFSMGGLASHYYAGITIVVVGAGLMFLWPPWLVLLAHGTIVGTYLVPNLIAGHIGQMQVAVSNVFFCSFTTTVVAWAQILNYRATLKQFQTQQQLRETRTEVEEANAQLLAQDRFKSQFFANVTHELKTPLAMILTPVEMLIESDLGPISDGQRSTLQTMQRNGTKLLKLINDLLDLSRLEESRLLLNVKRHDLVNFIQDLITHVEPLALRKGIKLSFETDLERVMVYCDLDRIERVLINLLSNATKFTPDEGRVVVRLYDDDAQVKISVQDTGIGFTAEQAKHIFERFYQTEMGSKRHYGGTGIGLALSQELIELHGGEIWAEPASPDKGAIFRFVLPKDRAHFKPEVLAKTDPGGQEPIEHDLIGSKVSVPLTKDYRLLDIAEATERRIVERDLDEHERTYTVLIVEDNSDVVRIIHMAMRRAFKVMTAPDGQKGLELALREHPNLIITDLMMPVMDGLELTRLLREDPKTQQIPIIMLTAHGKLDDRISSIETGVNAFLQKPFSARELLSTAKKLLSFQEDQAQVMLKQRMDSLETITGGLAHEINNPLNYIKNGMMVVKKDLQTILRSIQSDKTLSDAKLDKVQKRSERMFESIDAGVLRIADAVTLMRRYSREGYTRQSRALDVWQAIRDVSALLSISITGTGTLRHELSGSAEVSCVAEEFNQVIGNLIQNALEAVAETEGGLVRVVGHADEQTVTIEVIDNGPGLATDDSQKIFAPFFTTKGPGRGMGMGLTIVWRVVHSMNGVIQVQSEPGEGTHFTLRLPRASQADVNETGEFQQP